jgi:hypothetical protein
MSESVSGRLPARKEYNRVPLLTPALQWNGSARIIAQHAHQHRVSGGRRLAAISLLARLPPMVRRERKHTIDK